MGDQQIVDRADLRKWRIELPNLYDDAGLDPYEFRLLVHYKRVGTCTEGSATTARKCSMSAGQVSEKRLSLKDKGFITMQEIDTPRGKGYRIEVVDMWEDNFARYSSRNNPHPSPSEAYASRGESYPSLSEENPSPGETKKEPIKNKPIKKTPGAGAPNGAPSLSGSNMNARQVLLAELEKRFSMITGLPVPRRATRREEKAAAARWWNPLWTIFEELANSNLEEADKLMRLAVAQMRRDQLTVSAPQSILEVTRSIYGERTQPAPSTGLQAYGLKTFRASRPT